MISWLSIIGYGMGIVYIYTVVLHVSHQLPIYSSPILYTLLYLIDSKNTKSFS